MKLHYLSVPALLLVLTSCNWGGKRVTTPAVAEDTLTYTNKVYKLRAPDCGNKPDSACTSIVYKYPLFTKETALNDSVRFNLVKQLRMSDEKDTSLAKLSSAFIKTYQQYKKADTSEMFFTLEANASIVRQDSSLTTLQYDSYKYTGGAHGGSFTSFVNWNTKSHKDLTLEDIFIAGYKPALTRVAEKIFRKQENLSDTASLATDYFFENNKFALNNNFLITPVGIRFLYNQYEIKPYAAGQTDLLVPYNQIKKLLKPNTVTAQYLKK
ncbi:DUF3298 and DUF4163 domain-containing protein [Mucilaginibacter sp. KACC 22063]|uniref:DUF3298 and DUF4163 domain-containing protein n=1 Tax=Mucilaginibacter sp. KACC 22063 TaxID=3025666 RepID=UPI002365E8FC|nr:DUF3298 and DUF4163 domain-containing protein [Mucilaginibacter sp. KACC 22063]WDF53660.1 DUF3298 domain-containing protein [Mucilaginibacter sp. KACC 22063]